MSHKLRRRKLYISCNLNGGIWDNIASSCMHRHGPITGRLTFRPNNVIKWLSWLHFVGSRSIWIFIWKKLNWKASISRFNFNVVLSHNIACVKENYIKMLYVSSSLWMAIHACILAHPWCFRLSSCVPFACYCLLEDIGNDI